MAKNPLLDITLDPAVFQALYAELYEEHVNRDPAYTAADAKERVVAQWGDQIDGFNQSVQALLFDYPGSAVIDAHIADVTTNPHAVTFTQTGGEAAGTAAAEIVTHLGVTNPHAVTAAQAGADATGTAAAAIVTHNAVTDPHVAYLLADASRDVTAVLSGVFPTAGAHLSTMDYVIAPNVVAYTGAGAVFSASLARFATIDGNAVDFEDLVSATFGQEITILAIGTRTVTHGSGINLNGDLDYDMVSGDSLSIAYNGTDWIETARGGQAASPAFVTLSSADATPSVLGLKNIKLGGATTITNFDDGVEGQEIFLLAIAGRQVDHNDVNDASIRLGTGADYSMSIHETLTLVYDGAQWQEKGRN